MNIQLKSLPKIPSGVSGLDEITGLPSPLKRIIGDLPNKDRVVIGLEIDPLGTFDPIARVPNSPSSACSSAAPRRGPCLGGEVKVKSQSGRGSRFSLFLPAALACERPASKPDAVGAQLRGHVFVIEDNANVRGSLEAMLRDWGCAPAPVASGEFAIGLAEREQFGFDAIVVDYRLGAGLTGVDAAREISLRVGRAVPTLVLTGDTGKAQITEIEDSGFTVLHKPMEAHALRRELAILLKARSPVEQQA